MAILTNPKPVRHTLLWRHGGGDLNAWKEAGKKHLMLDVLPKMKLVDREIECAEGVAGRLLPR